MMHVHMYVFVCIGAHHRNHVLKARKTVKQGVGRDVVERPRLPRHPERVHCFSVFKEQGKRRSKL
jgi:hypothetical protein